MPPPVSVRSRSGLPAFASYEGAEVAEGDIGAGMSAEAAIGRSVGGVKGEGK